MGEFTVIETQKPDNVMLTERDKNHEKLMVSILKNLSDTPLVLKGGTALYLGYGLIRFHPPLNSSHKYIIYWRYVKIKLDKMIGNI